MNENERYAEYLEGTSDDVRLDPPLDPTIRAELDELRRTLAAPEVWAEPLPALADDVVAAVRAAATESPVVVSSARPRRRPRGAGLLAVAAAVLMVLAVGGVVALSGGDDGEEFALASTELAPDASGTATVESTGSGLSISLSVSNLPPAPPGTFYQAWMKGPDGAVPIGTFHARDGDGPIELWSGVDVDDYPTMTVTLQQEGAGPESSGEVVLAGAISS